MFTPRNKLTLSSGGKASRSPITRQAAALVHDSNNSRDNNKCNINKTKQTREEGTLGMFVEEVAATAVKVSGLP